MVILSIEHFGNHSALTLREGQGGSFGKRGSDIHKIGAAQL
jgi:hypothetical protein